MSGNVDIVTADSGMVENMGCPGGISLMSLFVLEMGGGVIFYPPPSPQVRLASMCSFPKQPKVNTNVYWILLKTNVHI